ncbi:MAG: hypothetical protein KDE34_17395 [Anaerolineales bacterium]|nr:hypothetical protein [Anaerolineales bacterium]
MPENINSRPARYGHHYIIEHDATMPQRDPPTGKYRQIWSELREPAGHPVGHAAIHRP